MIRQTKWNDGKLGTSDERTLRGDIEHIYVKALEREKYYTLIKKETVQRFTHFLKAYSDEQETARDQEICTEGSQGVRCPRKAVKTFLSRMFITTDAFRSAVGRPYSGTRRLMSANFGTSSYQLNLLAAEDAVALEVDGCSARSSSNSSSIVATCCRSTAFAEDKSTPSIFGIFRVYLLFVRIANVGGDASEETALKAE
jgi:hypothetical protein